MTSSLLSSLSLFLSPPPLLSSVTLFFPKAWACGLDFDTCFFSLLSPAFTPFTLPRTPIIISLAPGSVSSSPVTSPTSSLSPAALVVLPLLFFKRLHNSFSLSSFSLRWSSKARSFSTSTRRSSSSCLRRHASSCWRRANSSFCRASSCLFCSSCSARSFSSCCCFKA